MARVVAFIPDLLFGSNVVGALSAAGHEVQLTSSAPEKEAAAADVIIVDLTADADERIAQLGGLDLSATKTLAFYSHVETEVREQAQAARFDLVVPRSRMAREGHYGLHGMQERANVIGDKLALRSEVNAGTEVELRVSASSAYIQSRRRSWFSRKFAAKA